MTTPEGSAPAGNPEPTPTPVPTPTPTPAPVAGDWTSDLPADHKAMIEAKGFKSPLDVTTAYIHAERAISVDKIAVPKDGQWDPAARAKLGIPDKAEGYQLEEIKMPDGVTYDDKLEKGMLPIMHSLGLTPAQVNGLRKAVAEQRLGDVSSSVEAQAAQRTEAEAVLKKEFGAAFDARLGIAKRAIAHFGGDELAKELDATLVGNNPKLAIAFAKIGAALGEDTLKSGQGSGLGMTPGEAKAEHAKLMSSEEYRSKNHPMHAEAVKKGLALMELIHPNQITTAA